ncbi:MAG: hypothetical protein MRY74_12930 [Neomegalonema sp.]|nr:hypothetical protein [Neomegalonema sp.]
MAIIYLDDFARSRETLAINRRARTVARTAPCEKNAQKVEPEARVAAGLLARLRLWRARARHRAALRFELLAQPDSVLADCGMTREDAQREAAKPFWRA